MRKCTEFTRISAYFLQKCGAYLRAGSYITFRPSTTCVKEDSQSLIKKPQIVFFESKWSLLIEYYKTKSSDGKKAGLIQHVNGNEN